MKIALIGATGYAGSALLEELLSREYEVKALIRESNKIEARHNLEIIQVDVMDETAILAGLKGVDAVISAFNSGWTNPNIYEDYIKGSRSIVNAAKQSGIKRLLVVGGAGSLYVAPDLQLIDSSDFPKEYYAGANGARVLLDELKNEAELNWTMISPPIGFSAMNPGIRTNNYRVGTETPLMNGNQPGTISAEDLAIALIDELENGQFIRQRFTVAY